ncbi:MAG: phosphatase PAP2-related protein [bacterium]
MKKSIKSLMDKHGLLWKNRVFAVSAIIGILFFIASLFVNYNAIKYAAIKAGNSTTDILLDNLPVVNTDIIFSEGIIFFVMFIILLLILNPKIIPFVFKSVSLFICVRSIFILMTHLGPIPNHIAVDFDSFKYFSSGADLFFSGHTGLPFLMALLFWENKKMRRLFLACSITAAASVLLGHLHYTIDVFSAFFITYGIYNIAKKIFKKDYEIFKHGLGDNKIISG